MLKLSLFFTTVVLSILICPVQANAEPGESILPAEKMDAGSRALDPQENKRRYVEIIKPSFFQQAAQRFPLQGTPTLRVFLGQPGSNTSSLMRRVNYQNPLLTDPHNVDLNALQQYCPVLPTRSDEPAQMVHESQMHAATQWQQMLMFDLIASRNHVVMSANPSESASFEHLFSSYRHAGYRIELHVPAIPSSASELNIVEHHEQTRFSDTPSHLFSREVHAQGYRTLPLLVDAVERGHLVDQIVIHRRGGQIIYTNGLENGQWSSPPNAAAALEHERNRLLTHEERTAQLRRLSALRTAAVSASESAPGQDRVAPSRAGDVNQDLPAIPATLAMAMINPFAAVVRGDAALPAVSAPAAARDIRLPGEIQGSSIRPNLPSPRGTWRGYVPYWPFPGDQASSVHPAHPDTLPRLAAALPPRNGAPGALRSLLSRASSLIARFPK